MKIIYYFSLTYLCLQRECALGWSEHKSEEILKIGQAIRLKSQFFLIILYLVFRHMGLLFKKKKMVA